MKKAVFFSIIIFCSMVVAAPLFNSFNSGALTPLLKYRVDLQKRQMGSETMENMLVKVQGAVFRRPGTEYIGDVNDSNTPSRLLPFEYSDTDAYVLDFSHNSIGFYRTVGD